jgi:heme-degrading monooxygenase HmoA
MRAACHTDVDVIHMSWHVVGVHIDRRTMLVTWTALRCREARPTSPWLPDDAAFAQAGHAGAGCAQMPAFDGGWWAVLATWDDEARARAAAPELDGVDSWHVVLRPAAYRGDAALSAGTRPFEHLPAAGKTEGASAVITLAGFGDDHTRTGEFLERFAVLGRDVQSAPGHRAALVQAPTDGAVLTFSAWDTLRSAVTWAYHRPDHSATVQRNEEHRLVETSGFLRCAVVASSGSLGDQPDPLAGRTGSVVPRKVDR